MTVNKQIIREWVEALRGKKYKHGTQFLRNLKDEYDPLGILCDIVKDYLNLRWVIYNSECYVITDLLHREPTYYDNSAYLHLPDYILDFIGLKESCFIRIDRKNPKLPNRKLYGDGDLICTNDIASLTYGDKLDFNQIADILEEEFLK